MDDENRREIFQTSPKQSDQYSGPNTIIWDKLLVLEKLFLDAREAREKFMDPEVKEIIDEERKRNQQYLGPDVSMDIKLEALSNILKNSNERMRKIQAVMDKKKKEQVSSSDLQS